MFFSFDGIDGAGKSTQMTLFCEWLSELGHDVLVCRDPGTTQLGEAIRAMLLGAEFEFGYRAEMLMYMAARAQMVEETIRPGLESGKTVVSDRFVLATVAYQGAFGGIEPNDIWRVGQIATNGLLPDLTLVLDLAPEIAATRLPKQKDRIERRGREYYVAVRRGFSAQAARFPKQIQLIDADHSIQDVQAAIRAATIPYVSSDRET